MYSDIDYLKKAYEAARLSPDPSTQNGAVIPYVFHGNTYLLSSCNKFPEDVEVTPERLQRPLKYNFIEHAERNVIYLAAKWGVNLAGLTMYVPWAACSDCARGIICSGLKRVVAHKDMMDNTPEHWKESIKHAFIMFEESGVTIDMISGKLDLEPIVMNGQPFYP